MRIAHLRYTNVLPFHWRGHEYPEIELVDCFPSDVHLLTGSGTVDACPMPVAKISSAPEFEPLAGFAIAAKNSARSVLLFSRSPIHELGGATVAVTGESTTSAALLRLLLGQRYGLDRITYVEDGDVRADAELLIGDRALLRSAAGYPGFRYDLAAEWRAWQDLPFVFARWLVRRDLPASDKDRLADMLAASLSSGLAQIDQLARGCALARHMPTERIAGYLKNLTYVLDDEDERGQRRFVGLIGQSTYRSREGGRS